MCLHWQSQTSFASVACHISGRKSVVLCEPSHKGCIPTCHCCPDPGVRGPPGTTISPRKKAGQSP